MDINVPQEETDYGPSLWQLPSLVVSYTPTCETDLPCHQKHLALEAFAEVTSSIPASHTHGSLQTDERVGCVVFSPTMEPPNGGRVGRRLLHWSGSTYYDLHGLLDAVTLIRHTKCNGLDICASQSAFRALCSPKPAPSTPWTCTRNTFTMDSFACRRNSEWHSEPSCQGCLWANHPLPER